MADPGPRKPRFSVGDRVEVIAHGDVRRRVGSVAEIVSAPIDAVFRYRVRFDDETSGVFFGFELERIADPRASSY
jgi:hypothetical protein